MKKIKIGNFTPNLFSISCVAFLIFMLFRCAGQYPPPGGPIDTTSPNIIYSDPMLNSTFFRKNKIFLEFDKYMDQRSVQEAIFVSPDLGTLEFDWSGKELEISFEGKLRDNTTYVLIVGTSAKDRRGNNLAETFSLPFSTGESIDSCYITGKVYSEKPEAIKIFAFKILDRQSDTIDLTHTKPDYLSQTSKDGSFSLKYLGTGKYRLFAIRDVYNNLIYDAQVDQYGTAQFDVLLQDSITFFNNLNFRITLEDTTPPFISNVKSLNKHQIQIVLSEPVKDSAEFFISDILNFNSLQVNSYFLIKPNTFLLYTNSQDSIKYKLTTYKICDTAGNEIIPEKNQIEFYGSIINDTIAPYFEFQNIKNNENNVMMNKYFLVSFNEEIIQNSFVNGFHLLDSAGNDVPGNFVWETKLKVKFLPIENLKSKMKYKVKIDLDSLIDIFGNSIKDSTIILEFSTIDKNKLSSINGKVIGKTINLDYKNVIIEIFEVNKIRQKIMETKPNDTGEFVFNDIPEGKYILEAFSDKNGNMKYDFGRIKPFVHSEIFTVYPDTINLRARWPIENVSIKF